MSTASQKRQPIPFGKYLLLDRINIGGMAEVWRAKTFGAGGFERLVAIKRILPNIAEDEEFISMFIDEAKITVQLNHANIAQIYELAHIANSYCIAMEYISGKDMRAVFDRCRKRGEPAPIPLTCYLIARCCEGLDYAHRNKDRMGRDMHIVHRDVSPQNTLISYDGEVKVIDFGIAKAAGKATKTQAGILKGKFGYMSPEQIRGLPLDRRSDVFAIGICLYEMLTGERLFVGDSDFSVLEKVRKVEVLPPSHFNRRIPDALEKIVMKALAKDVEDRYQYASELSDDLQRFLITAETVFGRKDLAAFMKATFAEEVEKEKQRLQDYVDIKQPSGMISGPQNAVAPARMSAPVPVLAAPVPVLAANSSAVTAVPTASGPLEVLVSSPASGAVPMSQMETALGMIVPARPPAPLAMTAPPVPSAPTGWPRLSAAPAAPTAGKDEHATTILVDSNTPFDPDDTNPAEAVSKRDELPPKLNELQTDPDRGVVARESVFALVPPRASPSGVRTNPARPPVSTPAAEVSAPAQASVQRPPPPPAPSNPEAPIVRVDDFEAPVTTPSSYPLRASNEPENRHEMIPPESNGGGGLMVAAIVAVIAAIIALVVGGLAITGKFKPPQGLLMLDVPAEVAGQSRINVNGKDLTEPDGKGGEQLITHWPQLLSVPAGKVTVMIVAPGYDTLIEQVEVKEGNEISKLKHVLKKKENFSD